MAGSKTVIPIDWPSLDKQLCNTDPLQIVSRNIPKIIAQEKTFLNLPKIKKIILIFPLGSKREGLGIMRGGCYIGGDKMTQDHKFSRLG